MRRANVQILFVVAMSNHYHAGLHDPDGNYPIFAEHFHALLARCQNAHLGRFEAFWSSDATSVVRLLEPSDVLDKMVYAFCNPAAADLVDTADEWPGVCSFSATMTGGLMTAVRPRYFFRQQGELPDTIDVPIHRPRGFVTLTASEWKVLIDERVRATEATHRERRRTTGASVLGSAGVLAQDPFDSPKSVEPRFNMKPSVAGKSKWARVEALGRSKAFLEKYLLAIRSWMAGAADAVFPYGTFWMRKFARVLCDPA